MSANHRGDDRQAKTTHEGKDPMVARESDEPRGRRLVDVTKLAAANLETIIDWGFEQAEATEGEQGAEQFYRDIRTDPVMAAWHARAFGYSEGRADATEEIRSLQGRIEELEKHSLSERLFTIMLKLDERIGRIERAIAGEG